MLDLGSTTRSIVTSLEMYSAMVELHPDAAVGAGDVLRVRVLPDAPDAARAAIESAVGRVEIAQVHRVYRMGSRNESMLTNYISMVVPSGAEAEVLLMLLDDGNEILYRSDYGGLGTVGFRVHVPFSVQVSSGESVLKRANRYHGLGFVDRAAPVFAPLYQTQHAPLVPSDALYEDEGDPDGDLSLVRWHYKQMGMADAWGDVYNDSWANVATAEHKVVAVIDNGMFLKYTGYTPDANNYTYDRGSTLNVFPANLNGNPELVGTGSVQWFNTQETGGATGVDNDSNGYIDDYFGWDFVGSDPAVFDTAGVVGDNIPFPDPIENPVLESKGIRGHATGAAVVIAGIPNNDNNLLATEVEKLNNDSVNETGTDGGMVGICPSCEIMPIRAHTQSYSNGAIANDTSDVFYAGRSELAILYAAGYNNGTYSGTRADVLGIMIAIESYDPMFHEAIKIARMAGCVLIGSAGNNGVSMDSNPYFPNVWPEVLAVGSSEYKVVTGDSSSRKERRQSGTNARFPGPNYGWALDVVAYSVSQEELNRSSSSAAGQEHTPHANYAGVDEESGSGVKGRYDYGYGIGTSSAMPQVAALAGLVLTRRPELSPMEVQAVIQVAADDLEYTKNGTRTWDGVSKTFSSTDSFQEIAGEGRDMYTGWGRIDAQAALTKAGEIQEYFTVPNANYYGGKQRLLSVVRDDHTDEPGTSATQHVVFDGWIVENASSDDYNPVTETKLNIVQFSSVARLDLDAQTLYLKGVVDVPKSGYTEAPTDSNFSMMGVDNSGKVEAYISTAGNLMARNQVFSITTADRAPDYFHRVTTVTKLTDLFIDNASEWTAPSTLEGNIIELVEKPSGQFYELSKPINFNGVNFVIRSENPGDMDVVKNTVLKLDAAKSGRIITFSGTETNRSGVTGITIEGDGVDNGGIEGNGATATISFCRFVNNYTSGDGGAIHKVYGDIYQNVFGDLDYTDGTGGNYAAGYGGAITLQFYGHTYQNIFWYNSAGMDGGALFAVSTGIYSNLIFNNIAGGNGGGIGNSRGWVQSNIIYGNKASTGKGGGLYNCHGNIVKNTIYGNRASSAAYGVADCDRDNSSIWFRDNVIWDNAGLTGALDGKRLAGHQLTKSIADDDFNNSAISETVVPSGTDNIGPFSGSNVTDLLFEPDSLTATGSGYPSYNWGTFLHILGTSPLVNAGHSDGDVDPNPPTGDETNYSLRYFRDIDDQVGPLVLDENATPSVYKRDIGADENPTPASGSSVNAIQWWERF